MRLKGIIRSVGPGKPLQAASDDIGACSCGQRIAELEAALRGLVEAVKAGEAVSGAEAMGAAEAALANQQ